MTSAITKSGIHVETCVEVTGVDKTAPRNTRIELRTDHHGCNDLGVFYMRDLHVKWKRRGQFFVNNTTGRCPDCRRRYRMRVPLELVVEARLRC